MGLCGSKNQSPDILENASPPLPRRDKLMQSSQDDSKRSRSLNATSSSAKKSLHYLQSSSPRENYSIPTIVTFDIRKYPQENALRQQQSNQKMNLLSILNGKIIGKNEDGEDIDKEQALRIIGDLEIQLKRKKNTILENIKVVEDTNSIIFESELFKYHAGVGIQVIERYCCITRTGFAYYKNQWSSLGVVAKPIQKVAIEDIQRVRRVNFKLDDAKKYASSGKTYQFEIILRHDLLSEKGNLSYMNSPLKSKQQKGINAHKLTMQTQSPQLKESVYEEAQKMHFQQIMKRKNLDIEQVSITLNTKQKVQDKVNLQTSSSQVTTNKSTPLKKQVKNVMQQQIVLSNLKDKEVMEDLLQKPLEQQEVSLKNVGASKYINNNASLSNRYDQLMESEKRLIFMTPNEKLCDIWICLINYLQIVATSSRNAVADGIKQ